MHAFFATSCSPANSSGKKKTLKSQRSTKIKRLREESAAFRQVNKISNGRNYMDKVSRSEKVEI